AVAAAAIRRGRVHRAERAPLLWRLVLWSPVGAQAGPAARAGSGDRRSGWWAPGARRARATIGGPGAAPAGLCSGRLRSRGRARGWARCRGGRSPLSAASRGRDQPHGDQPLSLRGGVRARGQALFRRLMPVGKDEVKQALLAAAAELFAERGPRAV